MAKQPRVLIAGESWTTHSIHQKGFDSFIVSVPMLPAPPVIKIFIIHIETIILV